MVYVVLIVTMVLIGVALTAAVFGICSYTTGHAAQSFLNLMVGVATSAFGAAILLCAVYTRLPFNAECYAMPIGFCLFGLPFLLVGGIQFYREGKLYTC